MAKRVYLAETDGTQFPSKAEAEAHDEKVRKEETNIVFQEKLALFLSETDYKPVKGKELEAAVTSILETIRDNPLAFMEVMIVLLPKQWARKLKERRDDTAKKKTAKKKTAKKKGASKKKSAATKKAGKSKKKPEAPAFDPDPDNVAFPATGEPTPEKDVEAEQPEETPPAAFEEVTEAPDPPAEEVQEETPPPPPPEETPPPPPPTEETPPPPPPSGDDQLELTPVPPDDDIGESSDWRDEDDSPIPPAD